MNRPLFKPVLKAFSIHHPVLPVATAQSTHDKVQAGTPWWQLYTALIMLLGGGIFLAVNAPNLLHNHLVLIALMICFFGFIFTWLRRHEHELETEPWSPPLGMEDDLLQP